MAIRFVSTSELSEDLSFLKIFQAFLIVVVTIVLSVIIKYLFWRRKFSQQIPGKPPKFLDLLGNLSEMSFREKSRNGYSVNVLLLQFMGGFSKILQKQKLFCLWFFCEPVIVLAKAEAVEVVLNNFKLIEKSWFYKWIQPALGFGLVTSGAEKWKSRRKLLAPCFHSDLLRSFVTVMNKETLILVKRLQEETSKDYTDIDLPLSLCALDIICETMLGVHIGAQEKGINKYSQFVDSANRGMALIIERIGNCLHWSDFIYGFTSKGREMKKHMKIGEDFTKTIIQEKKMRYLKGELKIGECKRNSLMDVLMEHHLQTKDFSEEDIREELITFTLAGHDTTATSMIWTLYLIGLHPSVQSKIHEELHFVFGDDIDRLVTMEDFKNLKYLECVIKESNRLYPSAPLFARELDEDTIISGYNVPKGTTCLVEVFHLHRDEDTFPNPELFDPDRFLPENSTKRHPYAYIPFSAGPRNCIGQRFAMMEMKVILSTILRHYTIESLDSRDIILPSLKIHLKPSMPVRLRIRPRNSKQTNTGNCA